MDRFLELLSYYQNEYSQSFDNATKSALQQLRLENVNTYIEITKEIPMEDEKPHRVTDN